MTDEPLVYRIVSDVHVNKWSDDLGRAVPGHDLRVWWAANGNVLHVFVPDGNYLPASVDSMIREAGAASSAVSALGR